MAVGIKDIVKELCKGKSVAEKKEAKAFTDSLFNEIVNMVNKGEKVTITGFGSYKMVHWGERKGFNPSLQKAITIPAKSKLKFTQAKSLEMKQKG